MIHDDWVLEQLTKDDPVQLRDTIRTLMVYVKELEKRKSHFAMERFIQNAWPVIWKFLDSHRNGRWSFQGKFGATTFSIYEMAGRLMITFSLGGKLGSPQVTYITADNDASGSRFGLQSYEGTYWNHDTAINDVTLLIESRFIEIEQLLKREKLSIL
jgi:hypothetical protein